MLRSYNILFCFEILHFMKHLAQIIILPATPVIFMLHARPPSEVQLHDQLSRQQEENDRGEERGRPACRCATLREQRSARSTTSSRSM